MTSNVIDLKFFLRAQNDNLALAPVPKVYRMTGSIRAKPTKGRSRLIKAPIQYTMTKDEVTNLKRQAIEPVEKLNPAIDKGWVIVREHPSLQHLLGYMANQRDRLFGVGDLGLLSSVYHTDVGYYSLTHRLAPKGSPNHLLIYVFAQKDAPNLSFGEQLSRPESYRIYHPDGAITDDQEILYPFIEDTDF